VDSHLLLTPSDILAAPAGEVPGYGQETNPAEVGVLGDKNVFGDYEAASGTGFIGLFGLLDPENDGYLQNLPLAHLLVRDGTDVTVVGQVDLYSNAMPSNTEGTESVEIVPEPMTMSLLGLGGLAVLRRRRK
jgi:hypothetical protein